MRIDHCVRPINMAAPSKSEEVLAKKFDECVADSLVKIGGGLVTGAVFSLFLFKRKAWPIFVGLGFGSGAGYTNCQNQFNQPYLVLAERVKIKVDSQRNSAENTVPSGSQ